MSDGGGAKPGVGGQSAMLDAKAAADTTTTTAATLRFKFIPFSPG
jgi:hypothetical protein